MIKMKKLETLLQTNDVTIKNSILSYTSNCLQSYSTDIDAIENIIKKYDDSNIIVVEDVTINFDEDTLVEIYINNNVFTLENYSIYIENNHLVIKNEYINITIYEYESID